MKLNLPDTIASPQDLTDMILEIREYSKWYSHNAIKKTLKGSDAPNLSGSTKEFLRQHSDTSTLSDLVDDLEKFRSNAPTISITLAAVPTGDLKKTIVAWTRTNLSPDTLINFQFNSTILGGIVVKCGSRIFDWSFRRGLLDNRNKFPGLLRNV